MEPLFVTAATSGQVAIATTDEESKVPLEVEPEAICQVFSSSVRILLSVAPSSTSSWAASVSEAVWFLVK